MPKPSSPIDPSPILQTAFAFWSSKVLLTAVEFGVFTQLGGRRVTGAELGGEIGAASARDQRLIFKFRSCTSEPHSL